jgi:hypothetical protein
MAKIIRVEKCGGCPEREHPTICDLTEYVFCPKLNAYVKKDTIDSNCPLEDALESLSVMRRKEAQKS